MPVLELAEQPDQSEHVIGLVGAVGVDLHSVVCDLQAVLTAFEYETIDVHLTDPLRELDWSHSRLSSSEWDQQLHEAPVDKRIWSYMDAGNALRESWDRDDAFALMAINAIQTARKSAGGDSSTPLPRRAYVLRSLKRIDEVRLLRNVYSSRFVQISIYSPREQRESQLRERIEQSRQHPTPPHPERTVDEIIKRDHAEAADHGQQVEKIFHGGDFFVQETGAKAELLRVVEVLFGHPNRTPTRDEAGMFHAVAAARRSSELGRQVGAAICTSDGSVIAVGYNDVPKAGGGLYDDESPNDAREFRNESRLDTNDRKKRELAESVARQLVDAELGTDAKAIVQELIRSPIDDLIEFVRAVHAEMAAITDAVRRGVGIADSVLYATTFPCHHCARHIVASGITRVVYIEPYPKSLAAELHSDSIAVDSTSAEQPTGVSFVPFVGVGPRRYLELFSMPRRKDEHGRVREFSPTSALPRIDAIEDDELVPETQAHIGRERRALEILYAAQHDRGPRFSDFQLANDPVEPVEPSATDGA